MEKDMEGIVVILDRMPRITNQHTAVECYKQLHEVLKPFKKRGLRFRITSAGHWQLKRRRQRRNSAK
jgi:hypothetical protein